MAHDYRSYRLSAVEGLALVRTEESAEHLLGMLEDESWNVRLSALVALGRKPYTVISEVLMEMLGDRSFLAVKAALEILAEQVGRGWLNRETSGEELVELLGDIVESERGNLVHDARKLRSIITRL